jgi:hypothetical protein
MLSRGSCVVAGLVGNHGVEPCNYRPIRAAARSTIHWAEGARIERAWDASPNLGLANRCHCHSASLPSCAERESDPHVLADTGF